MSGNIFGSSINPNTIYYILIYLLILGVRFFKLRGSNSEWQENFFVGLEFVYSSIGIAILVLANADKETLGAVLMIYCVLLIFAVFLDASDGKFTLTQRFYAHLVVIGLVVLGATYFNQTLLFPHSTKAPAATSPAEHSYTVSIPYLDLSLRSYVGDKLGARRLAYLVHVNATSREDAIARARSKFWDKDTIAVAPIDTKKPKDPTFIILNSDDIVVEQEQIHSAF